MMLLKRSFGLTRSLFILYVHKRDRLNFGMLSVETAVFDCICWFSSSRDRKGQSYPVEYYLVLVEEYSKGKMHKSEAEPGSGNVNTVYFVSSGQRKYSSLFTMNEHAIANVYLYLSFLLWGGSVAEWLERRIWNP